MYQTTWIEKLMLKDVELKCIGFTTSTNTVALEPCKLAEINYNTAPAKAKKGKQMSRYYDEYNDCYVEGVQTDAQDQRNYFKSRVQSIACEIDSKLMTQFGLRDDEAPKNFEEFLARIQAGKYVFKDEKYKTSTPYWRDYIRWRDPAVKEDEVGYQAAWNTFTKERDKTLDAVMALPADKAMAAVQALETWTAK